MKYILIPLLFFFVLFSSCSLVVEARTPGPVVKAKPSRLIMVDIYNPYGISVKLLLKCDWSKKTKKFAFKREYVIKPRSVARMFIPPTVKRCQIWPKVGMF